MRRWGRATLGLLLIVATATDASVESSDQLFRTRCIGEKKTAFARSDSGWDVKQLEPEKYLIEKLTFDGRADSRSLPCSATRQDEQRYEDDDQIIDYGCYSVREVGAQSTKAGSETCAEMWIKTTGKLLLDYVSCKAIRFKADGYFVATQWDTSRSDDKSRDKDFLEITIGNCSVIE